jgi:hypothetical protein
MTDAEKKARDAKPPPVPESVQVAQVREAGANQRNDKQLAITQSIAAEQFKLDEGKLQADYETALGDLSLKHGVSKDQIRAMLAKTVMTLNTQTALTQDDLHHRAQQAAADRIQATRHKAMDVATAAAEPAGKAEAGHAFEQ